MLNDLRKCVLVLLCQLEQRLREEHGVEFLLQIVGQLPQNCLKLGAGQFGICVGFIDAFASLPTQLEGLRDAVRKGLRFDQTRCEVERDIREPDTDLWVRTEPGTQFFSVHRINVVAGRH